MIWDNLFKCVLLVDQWVNSKWIGSSLMYIIISRVLITWIHATARKRETSAKTTVTYIRNTNHKQKCRNLLIHYYIERQKKHITSSEWHSLKSTASTWFIFGHRLGKFKVYFNQRGDKCDEIAKRSSFKNHRNCLP